MTFFTNFNKSMSQKFGFRWFVFKSVAALVSLVMLLTFPFSDEGSFIKKIKVHQKTSVVSCLRDNPHDKNSPYKLVLRNDKGTKSFSAMKNNCSSWVGRVGIARTFGGFILGFESEGEVFLNQNDALKTTRLMGILIWLGIILFSAIPLDKLYASK